MVGELTSDGMDGVSFELALDFLRLRINRLIFLAVVCDPDDASLSELDELEESDVEESRMSARTPG
jgi:hypothetical protein